VAVCPTGAIELDPSSWAVDAGRCVLCGACATACPRDAIRLGQRFELAARTREGLRIVTRLDGAR
jgi:formate hydrogenlyase subunit 6/NADH:ubiquinone oxidoreductase subunit I